MTQVKKIIMVALFLLTHLPQAHALEPEEIKDEDAQFQKGQESPSMDLLEFLGEWETQEGDWIDPEELGNMPLDENGNDKKDDE